MFEVTSVTACQGAVDLFGRRFLGWKLGGDAVVGAGASAGSQAVRKVAADDGGDVDRSGDGDDGDEVWPEKSDDEILKPLRTRNKQGKITRLLEGNTQDYAGESEADAGLASELLYYCGPGQTERIMRTTGLARPKWDSPRKLDDWPNLRHELSATYLGFTIAKAFNKLGGDDRKSYWHDQAQKAATAAVTAAARKSQDELLSAWLLDGGRSLERTKDGQIKSTVRNAAVALCQCKQLAGVLGFDEFAHLPVCAVDMHKALHDGRAVLAATSMATGKPLDPDDVHGVDDWLQRVCRIELTNQRQVTRALMLATRSNRFNSAHDRLNQLEADWRADGCKSRLRDWLPQFAGLTPADIATIESGGEVAGIDARVLEYMREVGRRLYLCCAKRILTPGTKVDTVVILESAQGFFKQTLFKAMAECVYARGYVGNLSLHDLGPEFKRNVSCGRIIGEFEELAGMNRAENETLKATFSAVYDSVRPMHADLYKDIPRSITFVGSVNASQYLRDPENRRYWPVKLVRKLRRAELEAFIGLMPMLWGEAWAAAKAGERHWFDDELDPELVATQVREAARRLVPDTWVELIDEQISEKLAAGMLEYSRGRSTRKAAGDELDMTFRLREMMAMTLGVDRVFSPQDEARFRQALTKAGWEHYTAHGGQGRWRLKPETKSELRQRMR